MHPATQVTLPLETRRCFILPHCTTISSSSPACSITPSEAGGDKQQWLLLPLQVPFPRQCHSLTSSEVVRKGSNHSDCGSSGSVSSAMLPPAPPLHTVLLPQRLLREGSIGGVLPLPHTPLRSGRCSGHLVEGNSQQPQGLRAVVFRSQSNIRQHNPNTRVEVSLSKHVFQR